MKLDNEDDQTQVVVVSGKETSLKQLFLVWKAAVSELLFGPPVAEAACSDKNSTSESLPSLTLLCALYDGDWPSGRLPIPVHLRERPCYSPVVAPLLVVLDLDHTILRYRLSDMGTSTLQSQPQARGMFVDADFLHSLGELLTAKGHHLAIASFTEGNHMGSEHSAVPPRTPAKTVVRLLDCVLPMTRPYLTQPHQVVCMPASRTDRKLPHLRLLQQRLSRVERNLASTLDTAYGMSGSHTCGVSPSSFSCNLEGCTDVVASSCGPPVTHVADLAVARGALEPWRGSQQRDVSIDALHDDTDWVSTEVVLIDDNADNCASAADHGYHAFCCAGGGLTHKWLARNPALVRLLGLTLDELCATRTGKVPPASVFQVHGNV